MQCAVGYRPIGANHLTLMGEMIGSYGSVTWLYNGAVIPSQALMALVVGVTRYIAHKGWAP